MLDKPIAYPAGREVDTLVVETARSFAAEKLAPQSAAREKAKAIEPEIVAALA